jgi:hypothetical protein
VKSIVAFAAAALVLAAPSLAGLGGMDPYPQLLIREATAKVRSKAPYKKAVLLEADGAPKAGTRVKTADGIIRWRFVYDNQPSGTKFRTVFLSALGTRLGQPVGNRGIFEEDRRIATLPAMTLSQAIAKLRAKGHRQAFGAVTLRFPLGPGFNETLYIFTFGSGNNVNYWSVGTKTGKVKRIS